MSLIAILSHCTADRTSCSIARCNHERYASTFGYTYVAPRWDSDDWHAAHMLLHGTRFKTFSVLRNLKSYDFVLWIDSDALFLRFDIPIEHWISKQGDADIFVAADIPGFPFPAGVMLIRNSRWSSDFFARAGRGIVQRPVRQASQDQPIFFDMLARDEFNESRRIKIFERRERFQAFEKLDEVTTFSWTVHMTCCSVCDQSAYDARCYAHHCTRKPCRAKLSVCQSAPPAAKKSRLARRVIRGTNEMAAAVTIAMFFFLFFVIACAQSRLHPPPTR